MDLRRLGRIIRRLPGMLRQAVVNAWDHRILGLSAEAAFWQLLSLPSLFLALIATLGYVSRWFGPSTVNQAEAQLERALGRAFSSQVTDEIITPILHEVLHSGRADVISAGFLLALWAGSSATATFVNTITIAYGMRDLRGALRSRLLALWLFLGSVAVGVIVLPMLVLGPSLLARAMPDSLDNSLGRVIHYGYYPVITVLLLTGLTTLYHLAPPRRLPWRRGVPGSLLAILVFLGGSVALRTYIHFILSRNHAYGTLAAPIATLLFFYILALGVLLGAEFNAVIERYAPSPPRQPRVLNPRSWSRVQPDTPTDRLPDPDAD